MPLAATNHTRVLHAKSGAVLLWTPYDCYAWLSIEPLIWEYWYPGLDGLQQTGL